MDDGRLGNNPEDGFSIVNGEDVLGLEAGSPKECETLARCLAQPRDASCGCSSGLPNISTDLVSSEDG